jgi:transcriptional regulator with PAS, ATPase and Fis domain
VAVNCSAIPENLLEAEFFGARKGAYTGSAQDRQGYFQAAKGGTLFLDEITEMPLELQVKLLRVLETGSFLRVGATRDKAGLIESAAGGSVFLDEIADLPRELQSNLLRFLQEKTIYRLGATRSVEVDVRIIAASHVDLQQAVAEGLFRQDLYYRLNVLPITVPPLRERPEDLAPLAEYFFHAYAADKPPRLKGFSSAALAALRAHPWPGNVRELINRVRRAMVLAEGRLISPHDLGLAAASASQLHGAALGDSREHAERAAIVASLERTGGNVTHAARELAVSRATLYRHMAKHGLAP